MAVTYMNDNNTITLDEPNKNIPEEKDKEPEYQEIFTPGRVCNTILITMQLCNAVNIQIQSKSLLSIRGPLV